MIKHGGGSLMIWGCMSWSGQGFMCKIEGNMDKHLYKSILEDELWQTIKYYNMDPSHIVFQQDNDSKHTASIIKTWLSNQPFILLENWPAQSPDLNPMEHLWWKLKHILNCYETPPKGMLELWERVQAAWEEITPEICRQLVENMPRRIVAVISAKKQWTKY